MAFVFGSQAVVQCGWLELFADGAGGRRTLLRELLGRRHIRLSDVQCARCVGSCSIGVSSLSEKEKKKRAWIVRMGREWREASEKEKVAVPSSPAPALSDMSCLVARSLRSCLWGASARLGVEARSGLRPTAQQSFFWQSVGAVVSGIGWHGGWWWWRLQWTVCVVRCGLGKA